MSKKNKNNSSISPKIPEIKSTPKKGGGVFDHFWNLFGGVNNHVNYLNTNKLFAGIVMLTLNIGSRFVTIELSKSAESFLKWSVTRQILIFAICWMGTRDIYVALVLTAVFVVLADHVFNHESRFCMIPEKHRKKYDELKNNIDTNGDGIISDKELQSAIDVLQKAKKLKEQSSTSSSKPTTSTNENVKQNTYNPYNPIQLR